LKFSTINLKLYRQNRYKVKAKALFSEIISLALIPLLEKTFSRMEGKNKIEN